MELHFSPRLEKALSDTLQALGCCAYMLGTAGLLAAMALVWALTH